MSVPFPPILLDPVEDKNPAIRLFGRRLFIDQTALEFFAEFLLVANSPKFIAGQEIEAQQLLPTLSTLRGWPAQEPLRYRSKMRLDLKLFAFLGSSKLDTRHQSHRQHYGQLLDRMKVNMQTANAISKQDVLRGLENLFQGFQGAGLNRTWCAQTFFPVSSGLLAGETIWNETTARAATNLSWDDAIQRVTTYFSLSRHRFLARGGELLYLQLCNALRQSDHVVEEWVREHRLAFAGPEGSPEGLHALLTEVLPRLTNQCPAGIEQLAAWIDQLTPDTAARTDTRGAECGWCPEESWPEGYLFAVELSRICRADIDPIERIELLIIGSALQVLRTLCAQAARNDVDLVAERRTKGGPLGYAWILAGPPDGDRAVWKLSERNLIALQKMIHSALRNEEICSQTPEHDLEKLYKEADSRYGHKLLLSLAKRIGLVVPKRGVGARFTLNDKILRYLVLALIRPGEKCTLDSFLSALYAHYGIAVAGEPLRSACRWSGQPQLEDVLSQHATWLEDMLLTSGFLVRLSDACSLVHNPFDGGGTPRFGPDKRIQ